LIVLPDEGGKVARWVAQHIPGCERGFGNCTALAVIDADTLVAGIVYHNYAPAAGVIEISASSTTPRWLTRSVLFEMFSYPFEQIGCQLVAMRIRPSDKPLRRMLKAYGFSEYLIPRLRGRHEAELVMTLTDDAWRANGFHDTKKDAANG